MGGASVRELSLTELEGEEDDDEEVALVEDRGVSWWVGLLLSEGAGPVVEVNRCSGGSEVRVEIQASSSTRRSSSEPNSSVTSSPTPSIRAIAHGNARGGHTGHTPAHKAGLSINSINSINTFNTFDTINSIYLLRLVKV